MKTAVIFSFSSTSISLLAMNDLILAVDCGTSTGAMELFWISDKLAPW